MIPDKTLCLDTLAGDKVPAHIVVHSEIVAEVAMKLAVALNEGGEDIDLPLLEAGALLHDVMKMKTIESGGDHAVLGGERVAELGFPELSQIVARHVNLGDWDFDGPVTEVELVNYADKRVRHTEIVSLGVRFEDLIERYGKSDRRVAVIREHWETLKRVEQKIFLALGCSPEDFHL